MITLSLSAYMLKDENGIIVNNEKGVDLSAAKMVARMLLESQEKDDPVKLFELGMRFSKDTSIDIDQSDYDLVVRNIKASRYTPLIKGQILIEMGKQHS